MDVFGEVRQRVDIEEAYRFYTGSEIRGHKAICCFHNEKNPSLGFHNGRYKCFACNESGDVINLVGKLFGLVPIDAVKRINEDFHLGLAVGEREKDPVKAARLKKELLLRRRAREEKVRIEKARMQRYDELCKIIKQDEFILWHLLPVSEITEEFRYSDIPGLLIEKEQELREAEREADELFEMMSSPAVKSNKYNCRATGKNNLIGERKNAISSE